MRRRFVDVAVEGFCCDDTVSWIYVVALSHLTVVRRSHIGSYKDGADRGTESEAWVLLSQCGPIGVGILQDRLRRERTLWLQVGVQE